MLVSICLGILLRKRHEKTGNTITLVLANICTIMGFSVVYLWTIVSAIKMQDPVFGMLAIFAYTTVILFGSGRGIRL